MFKISCITICLYIFSVGVSYSVGLSHSSFYGTAFSSSASGDFKIGDINPANFALAKLPVLGTYSIAKNFSDEFLLSLNNDFSKSALYTLVPYKNFVFYMELFNNSHNFLVKQPSNLLSGSSLGLSYRFSRNISVGGFLSYNYNDEEHFVDYALGILYLIPIYTDLIGKFGLYTINFAFSLNNFTSSEINFSYEGSYTTAVSVLFLNSYFIKVYFDTTFILESLLTNLVISSAFRLTLFKYIDVFFGFSGEDYFSFEHLFSTIKLDIPISVVDLEVSASYGLWGVDNIQLPSIDDINLLLELSYATNWFRLSRNTDNQLVYFTEPESILTPNGDGVDDFVTLYLAHKKIKKVKFWNLLILDSNGTNISTIYPSILDEEDGNIYTIPSELRWFGVDYRGQRVEDGLYQLKFIIVTLEGKKISWDVGSLALDSKPPSFSIFIPDKRYFITDDFLFRIFLRDKLGDIKYYIFELLDLNDKISLHKKILKKQDEMIFNIEKDTLLRVNLNSGSYTVRITAFDAFNNKKVIEERDLYFYSEDVSIVLEFPYLTFSPNNDFKKDILEMSFIIPFKEQVKSWKIDVLSLHRKKLVRTFRGDNIVPLKVEWDGTSDRRRKLESGVYFITLYVELDNGQTFQSLAYKVILDNNKPIISLKNYDKIFTPDGDGKDDIMTFYIDVKDESPILGYKLEFYDQQSKLVKAIKNLNVPPASISWDGVLDNGLTVNSFDNYYIKLFVLDEAGNEAVSKKQSIGIDAIFNKTNKILALDNNTLEIQLPNVYFDIGNFMPTSDSYKVLERLARFIKEKFQRHNIHIVGHTDTVGGYDFNIKLSRDRANFVRKYLLRFGLSEDSITIEGVGYTKPLFEDKDPEYQARNRRIEITISHNN